MSIFNLAISGVKLNIQADQLLVCNDSFRPFLDEDGRGEIDVIFRKVEKISVGTWNKVYEDLYHTVYDCGNHEYISVFFDLLKSREPYALARKDVKTGSIMVEYVESGSYCVSELRNCFAHLGFEDILVRRNRLYFHAACVKTEVGGVLFAGPSGIGKSTQAELWKLYRNSKIINGDRTILQQDDMDWKAWGSPYAGSSDYYINESCSISAIIFLKQGENCSLRRLNPIDSFRAVWSELTVYSWDEEFVEKASDLTMDLIRRVPVYEFCCIPDKRSVDYLERKLREVCH